MHSLLLAFALAANPTRTEARADPWPEMVRAAVPAVVSIDVVSTRAFDTERAGHGYATGFVVDAQRGIILTNRHVVEPGPVKSQAVLQNGEVLPLRALYRDPIHDFGFYQYDPATVRYGALPALELDPAGAKVGLEIRVVGNNAGEKLSIHSGTIARLDRDAPNYGGDNYNDFNTFYLQAAAGTTGGSSGSPVLDARGKVVALNAGSRRDSSASFYLPLDRVARALALIQAGQPVSRGSVHCVFGYTPYDELVRLGLRAATQDATRARNPEATGMLVVKEVLPGGPGDGKLRAGDILVSVDGAPVQAFIPLDAVLDDKVGKTVVFGVERGGVAADVLVPVRDLHLDTPDEFIEVGGDLLHDFSYQQARNHNMPLEGTYVASATYGLDHAGVPEGALIMSLAGVRTPNLAAFRAAVEALPQGARVPVRYVALADSKREQVAALRIERDLFPARICGRDDTTGKWPCVPLAAPPSAAPQPSAKVTMPAPPSGVAGKAARSLVWVEARLPYVLNGNQGDFFSGVGLVLDAEKGLVLVDRDTVPQSLADISVIVGGAARVPARLVYLHPEHNMAVVQFDPSAIEGAPLQSARLAAKRPKLGSRIVQLGLNGRQEYTWNETTVWGYSPFTLLAPAVPQYRGYNVDLIKTTAAPLDRGGVLLNERGEVSGFLASYVTGSGKNTSNVFLGLPADVVKEVVDAYEAGESPPDRTLGVAWATVPLAAARDRGVPDDELKSLVEAGFTRMLTVTHIAAGTPAAQSLQSGDLLLRVNGSPSASWRTLERAARSPTVRLSVWRGQTLHVLEVPTAQVPTIDLQHALVWAGALIQDESPAIALQHGFGGNGVYVSWRWFGSPADRYDLSPTWRIMAVDGLPITTLESFRQAVAGRPNDAPVRLDVRGLDDRLRVVTLELDTESWPTAELKATDKGWVRVELP